MIYFSSDSHFSHTNIITYSSRPFKDVEEMNAKMIENWNSVVKPEDIVYYLGDFSFNEKDVRDILPTLNGTKHLVSGNHDKTHSCHKDHKKAIRKYLSYGFSSVQDRMELKLGEREFALSHLPFLRPEDKDQRYSQFRPEDVGQWLLCGHVHEKFLWRGKQINVGVDQWSYTPVSETQILDLVAEIIEGEQV